MTLVGTLGEVHPGGQAISSLGLSSLVECSSLTSDGEPAACAPDLLDPARAEAANPLDEVKVVHTQHAQEATEDSRQVEDLG